MNINNEDLVDFIKSSQDFIKNVYNENFLNNIRCFQVGSIDSSGENVVSFIGRTSKNPAEMLIRSNAKVVIVDNDIQIPSNNDKCLIVAINARELFCRLLNSQLEKSMQQEMRSHVYCHIDKTAKIGAGTFIGSFCTVEAGVSIGTNCRIGDSVTILRDVVIGNNVNIAPGVVIGSDGFGYEKLADGSYIKFPHIGRVVVEDDVDIGANTVIDRGTLNETRIKKGVKIDNLVHISHNVEIGENCLIIANAMIGGGTKIGSGSWVGPSVNLLDRIEIGNDTFLGMGVSVIKNMGNGARFTIKNFLKMFLEMSSK